MEIRKKQIEHAVLLIALFIIVATAFFDIARADLSCNITTSCSATSIMRLRNDTGGFINAHAQMPSNTSYPNIMCCSSSTQTVGTSCTAWQNSRVLRLSGRTDAHVQDPYNSSISPAYSNISCISGAGTAICRLSMNSCPSGYTCMGSMASSSGNNYTDAHLANCSHYALQVCCFLNSLTSTGTPVLNSTYGTNTTVENLTVYNTSTSDADGHSWNFTYDWRRNGTSMSLLDMSFNTNISNYSNAYVRDHSTYGNNGTLGDGVAADSPTWIAAGKTGGAYRFDGTNDYIMINTLGSLDGMSTITMCAWAKLNFATNTDFHLVGNDALAIGVYNTWEFITLGGSGYSVATSNGNAQNNVWTFVCGAYNGTNALLYVNGTLQSSTPAQTSIDSNFYDATVGAEPTSIQWFWNGTVDEVMIFNRTLSAEQIMYMYQNGMNKLIYRELAVGNNWTVAVTPSDSYDDGVTQLSNSVLIRANSAPGTVTLIAPNETITDRYPIFNWTTATDVENDAITYDINVTPPAGLGCFGFQNSGISTNYTTSSTELCTDLDHSSGSYLWSVRACDGGGCGAWSSVTIFNVSSVNSVQLLNSTVSFGAIDPGASNNTTIGNPRPFLLENDGNIRTNISAYGNDSLFDAYPLLNDSSFQFMAGVNESAAFNQSRSIMNFINVTNQSQLLISTLLYLAAVDAAELEFRVTAPGFEPAGQKDSLVIITSSQDIPS